jgi:hypothetical protein
MPKLKPTRSIPKVGWSFSLSKAQLRGLGPAALAFRMRRNNGRWAVAPTPDQGLIVLLDGVTQQQLQSLPESFVVKIARTEREVCFAELSS